MAKQLVNPIERHVEKAVLGLAGLVLIAVVARYVVTTPNQLELGSETVTPNTVDQKVAQKAVEAAAKLRAAQPKSAVPEPLHDDFVATLNPMERGTLPGVVALGPEVPIVDRPGPVVGQASIVIVQAPAKPTLSHGRSMLITAAGGGQTIYVPADWVSVSAVFDVKSQLEAQKREYGPKGDELLFGPPQLQRRARRQDGSWSESDWQDVDNWPAVKLPKAPVITMIEESGKLIVDKDVLKAIDNFHEDLVLPKMQLDIIRPMPPDMVSPTRWTMPVITSFREVLQQDDEYLFPSEAPAQEPMDRYGLSGQPAKKQAPRELTPDQQRAKDMDDAVKLIEDAKKNKSENDAIKAFNLAAGILTDRMAGPGDKARAEKIKNDAEQVQRDIKREGLTKKVGQPAVPGAITTVKREKRPSQQIWAHDAAPESLENGGVYQYRMRFRVYNVLAGGPGKLSNPQDAAIVFVESDWSGPSDPVVIEPASMFFVTSDDAKDQEISVEFFQWYMGVWLKPDRRIKATIGSKLQDKQRTKAPDLTDETKTDMPEIEFAADATIVDIDFDRSFRERKAGTTPKGARFAAPATSTSVVFMDSQGRLQERFVAVDKNHPQKRELLGLVWKPKP